VNVVWYSGAFVTISGAADGERGANRIWQAKLKNSSHLAYTSVFCIL